MAWKILFGAIALPTLVAFGWMAQRQGSWIGTAIVVSEVLLVLAAFYYFYEKGSISKREWFVFQVSQLVLLVLFVMGFLIVWTGIR